MLLCLPCKPSINVHLSVKELEVAQSSQWVQQQGKGEAGFHHWSLDPKGRDPAAWGPCELRGSSCIHMALFRLLPEWQCHWGGIPQGNRRLQAMSFQSLELMGAGWSSLCLQTVQPQQALSAQTPASLLPQDRITCSCCSPFSSFASLWHHFTSLFAGRHFRSSKP